MPSTRLLVAIPLALTLAGGGAWLALRAAPGSAQPDAATAVSAPGPGATAPAAGSADAPAPHPATAGLHRQLAEMERQTAGTTDPVLIERIASLRRRIADLDRRLSADASAPAVAAPAPATAPSP